MNWYSIVVLIFFPWYTFYFSTSVAYGGKNKTSLGRNTDELFTEMKKIHNGSNVCELSILAQVHQSKAIHSRTKQTGKKNTDFEK